MEQLDSKYFERVITALKKAKNEQNIDINENFRLSLRAGLAEKAATMTVPDVTPGWADLILRNKLWFGGVPVVAAVALVAVSALNRQVEMPSNKVIQEVSNKQMTEKMPGERPSELGVRTFSSDLVMPPIEVLEQREKYLRGEGEYTNYEGLVLTGEGGAYQFLTEGIQLDLKEVDNNAGTANSAKSSATIVNDKAGDLAQPVQQDVNVNTQPANKPEGDDLSGTGNNASYYDPPNTLKYLPAETSVMIDSESVNEPQEQDTEENDVTDTEDVSDNIPSEGSGKILFPEMQTTEIAAPVETEPVAVPIVLPDGETARVKSLTNNYLDPGLPEVVPPADLNLQYDPVNLSLPLALEPSRIKYEGEDRDILVRIVSGSLKSSLLTLSKDYYINIVKFPDDTYRATLYEYGKAQRLLVIAPQTGGLKVITEVVY